MKKKSLYLINLNSYSVVFRLVKIAVTLPASFSMYTEENFHIAE